MNFTRLSNATLILGVIVALTNLASAAIMDSADFDWKYEMNILPDSEDVDGDSNPDWIAFGGGWTLTGTGTATYSTTTTNQIAGYETIDIYGVNVDPSTGRVEGHFTDGYTFEYRLKVPESFLGDGAFGTANSVTGGAGTKTAVSHSDARLGSVLGNVVDASLNSDGFHVFRVAQQGDTGLITMWRDDVEIASGFPSSYSHSSTFLDIGDVGSLISSNGGTVEIDYFRWTTGAFSPVPEPTALTLLGVAMALVYASRRIA